jgi:uncharacterized protein YjbI with pentapeptide repeats
VELDDEGVREVQAHLERIRTWCSVVELALAERTAGAESVGHRRPAGKRCRSPLGGSPVPPLEAASVVALGHVGSVDDASCAMGCSLAVAQRRVDQRIAGQMLALYQGGTRSFRRADLEGVSFRGANLESADLSGANFRRADLRGVNLTEANLQGADLSGSNLDGANLQGAHLAEANLSQATFRATTIGRTTLTGVSLIALCEHAKTIEHRGPSAVDHRTVLMSIAAPNLSTFLVQCGMPEVFVIYMIDSARSLQLDVFRMLQSTFISYGNPDEPFARRLYEALHRNGVTTFFFPEHAVPGEKLHRTMRKGVNEHDRVILVCSKTSLDRKGVLNEIEETIAREARDGGASYLIPIRLDNYVFTGWKPSNTDVAQAVRDRVVADFEGAEKDEAKFQAGMLKLLGALKQPGVPFAHRPHGTAESALPLAPSHQTTLLRGLGDFAADVPAAKRGFR